MEYRGRVVNQSRVGPLRVVGKNFTKDDIVGGIEGDMGYVDFEVLVRVSFSHIVVQGEGFPLDEERCVGDGVNERVAMLG